MSVPKPGGRKKKKSYASPAVEQAAQILYCLAASTSGQMRLVDICNEVGISGSKAHSVLQALVNTGLARRGPQSKGYALGAGLVTLSRNVLDDFDLPRLSEPVLDQLTLETRCTSVFGMISGDSVYVASKKEPDTPIRVVMRIGHPLPLSHGAHGKAIFAFLDDAERSRLLQAEDLYFHGHPGLLDRARLDKELAQCRREGFACDFGESAQGVNVVAAPVRGAGGGPLGFVEIFVLGSGENARGSGPKVVRAAETLSNLMGMAEPVQTDLYRRK